MSIVPEATTPNSPPVPDGRDPLGLAADAPLLRAYLDCLDRQDSGERSFHTPGHKGSTALTGVVVAGDHPLAGGLDTVKLRHGWLADAEPENAARIAAVALPHDWLTWRLRGFGPDNPVLTELTTDRSDASGTCYFDPTTNEYDYDLLGPALRRAFGNSGDSSRVILPKVLNPGDVAGHVDGFPEFPNAHEIVVGVGAGDNAGAALGLGRQEG